MEYKEKLENITNYFREVYMEAKRVTWPSRKDALKGTYIVLITVFITALFLGIVDIALSKIIQALIR